jgi:DNA gyrase/topoisomerase IV subunit A
VKRGFVEGQGNWGKISYPTDDRAGAYRYTECRASDSLNLIFEKYLNFVPWDNLELEKEPLYIPFPVPVGLIGSGLITGIGFHTTKIPRYKFYDLLKRVVDFLENKTPTTIIPFVDDCTITEVTPGDFDKILSSGEGKIKITPNVKIESHKITVYGKNPYIGFNNLKKYNSNYEETNGIPFCDVLDGTKYDSKTSVHLEITPSKNTFITKAFSDQIVKLLSSTENIKVNVIDDNNKVYKTGIDNLLSNSYNAWKKANLIYLQSDLERVERKIEELNIILEIRKILQSHPELLQNKTIKDVVNFNNSNYSDNELIATCNKHNIKTLIESHIDISGLIKEQTDLKSKINNIDGYVLKTLKNKYGL